MKITALNAHCRVFESFLVFTFSPLGTSCQSVFLSVHFSHLSLPPISLPHIVCIVLVLVSCWLCLFKKKILFSAFTPLSVLDSHSSSVSSHLPEIFTISLNDTWVYLDSLFSPDSNSDLFCLPINYHTTIHYTYIQFIAACLCTMSFCMEKNLPLGHANV